MIIRDIPFPGPPAILLDYIDRGASTKDFAFFQHTNGIYTDEILNAFETQGLYCQKVKTKIKHYILSFNKRDSAHISEAVLYDLTAKMIAIKAPDSVVYSRAHRDSKGGNIHVHAMVTNNKIFSDKSIRKSLFEFRKDHQAIEQYQLDTYPEIQHSQVYIRDKRKEITPFTKNNTNRSKRKNEVIDLLTEIAEQSSSLDAFYDAIEKHPELTLYSYRDKPHGVWYQNKRYRIKRAIPQQYRILERLQQLEILRETKETAYSQERKQQSITLNR